MGSWARRRLKPLSYSRKLGPHLRKAAALTREVVRGRASGRLRFLVPCWVVPDGGPSAHTAGPDHRQCEVPAVRVGDSITCTAGELSCASGLAAMSDDCKTK